jgi:hypothetical protein
MGYQVYPEASSGGIKTVQRGLAAGAGNVTISAVNINKAFVTVFGTASSGTVAATGAVNAASGTLTAANGTINAANGTLAAGTGVLAAANGAITTVGQDAIYTGNQTSTNWTPGGALNKFLGIINAAAKNIAMNATNMNADARNVALNATNIGLNATTVGLNATNITGGSTNLVSAVVQGFLANGTTLTVSGACRWEVVEFN